MDKNLHKSIKEYKNYVVDMDGTLYYKYPMRLRMLAQMAGYFLVHIRNYREAFLLKDYRHLRESEELLKEADCESRILRTVVFFEILNKMFRCTRKF